MIAKGKISILFIIAVIGINAAQDSTKVEPPAIISAENFSTKGNVIRIGDYLGINVKNLGSLVSFDDDRSLVLYLQNIPMRGIKPTFVDINNNLVVFPVVRNDSTKDAWDILYQPAERRASKPFTVSVGKDCYGAIKGSRGTITMRLYSRGWLYTMLVAYLFIVVGFFFLAKFTLIIRDGKVQGDSQGNTVLATFSLAKTQLAIWTLIIIGSVGYIFSVTGQLPVITGSTWILLAISIGTTAGAEIINVSHAHQVKRKSKNFFADILSDDDGMNIHRFQMAVWSIFLFIYFISRVYNKLDIPQLNNDLLTLMGISSGTYLGLKIPEDKEKDTDATDGK